MQLMLAYKYRFLVIANTKIDACNLLLDTLLNLKIVDNRYVYVNSVEDFSNPQINRSSLKLCG